MELFANSRNLACKSSVFEGMLECAGKNSKDASRPKVQLEESSDTLGALVPYFYSEYVNTDDLSFPAAWPFIRAVEKYQVSSLSSAQQSCLASR